MEILKRVIEKAKALAGTYQRINRRIEARLLGDAQTSDTRLNTLLGTPMTRREAMEEVAKSTATMALVTALPNVLRVDESGVGLPPELLLQQETLETLAKRVAREKLDQCINLPAFLDFVYQSADEIRPVNVSGGGIATTSALGVDFPLTPDMVEAAIVVQPDRDQMRISVSRIFRDHPSSKEEISNIFIDLSKIITVFEESFPDGKMSFQVFSLESMADEVADVDDFVKIWFSTPGNKPSHIALPVLFNENWRDDPKKRFWIFPRVLSATVQQAYKTGNAVTRETDPNIELNERLHRMTKAAERMAQEERAKCFSLSQMEEYLKNYGGGTASVSDDLKMPIDTLSQFVSTIQEGAARGIFVPESGDSDSGTLRATAQQIEKSSSHPLVDSSVLTFDTNRIIQTFKDTYPDGKIGFQVFAVHNIENQVVNGKLLVEELFPDVAQRPRYVALPVFFNDRWKEDSEGRIWIFPNILIREDEIKTHINYEAMPQDSSQPHIVSS